jgi:hypothetical protein
MSLGDQSSQFLKVPEVVEEYLERGPHGDYQLLKEIATSIKNVESENDLTVVQLLGTAVGTQRTSSLKASRSY